MSLTLKSVLIRGPSGLLEADYQSADTSRGVVLCHPHPLYGGTKDDGVLSAIESAFRESGYATLRFNFRGVGASDGEHDRGRGEVDDVCAASEWLRQQGCAEISLAGYSFGAVMALAASFQTGCSRLVVVAPPVTMIESLSQPEVPTLVLLGSADQMIDPSATRAWFTADSVQTEEIEGADHFFFSSYGEIAARVAAYLEDCS